MLSKSKRKQKEKEGSPPETPPKRLLAKFGTGRNLPPLPQRRTPVPRSSFVESGAGWRMATQEMHLASWSVTGRLFINDLAKQLVAELRAAC